MKMAAIAFTQRGAQTLLKIKEALIQQGIEAEGFLLSKHRGQTNLPPWDSTLHEWTKIHFKEWDALLFVGACGIAVRAVAPFLSHKTKDPAVVVVDEEGRFSISLVSGHLGGANDLAKKIASICSAVPVITTATDLRRRFAVDQWAVNHQLWIKNPQEIRTITSALLAGETIGIQSDLSLEGPLPQGIVNDKEKSLGICISLTEKTPFETTLSLVPKALILGIGCKKFLAAEEIEKKVQDVLKQNDLPFEGIKKVCSIDRKSNEPGILAFCRKYCLPFDTFSAKELLKQEGEFTRSPFVESVVGVDNVCERAALCGCEKNGKLLVSKQKGEGVTVAIAQEERNLTFEEELE